MALNGLGHFAGGLASGIIAGQRLHRDMERERREKEEYERQAGLRREAANTFGNIGQLREDGSVYTEENAYGDFSNLAAKYDPMASMQARTAGVQHKAAKTQLKGLERNERYAQNEEDVVALMQRLAGAPDDVFYPEVAKFASRYGNDGKSFGVDFDANAGWSVTMVDGNSGQVFRQPVGNRQDVVNQLMSYASPRMYTESQKLGLEGRKVSAAERTAAATEGYRRDQGRLIASQIGMNEAHAEAYRGMGQYYRNGGPGSQGGLRMPESSRIYLTGLQNRETALTKELSELDYSLPGARQQASTIQKQLTRIRSEAYDVLSQAKALPSGVTRTEFVGLEDPMDAAKNIMISFQKSEAKFNQALDAFEKDYAGSPEAAEAHNALLAFRQKQFYGRVIDEGRPVPGLVRPNIPPNQFPLSFGGLPSPAMPGGRGGFPPPQRPLGLMSNSARNVPPR